MSCRWCVHWKTEDGLRYNNKTGECRRFPAPIKTHHAYWCGELVLDNSLSEKSITERFFDQMHVAGDGWREERVKRIDLQKKNKELRKQLREKEKKS